MKYKYFRKKYPKFVYEKYTYKISDSTSSPQAGNNLEIFFDFRIEPDPAPETSFRYGASISFKPKVTIENIEKKCLRFYLKQLDNLIFHLGLMEIPSYWKATCSPEIIIKAGPLNQDQIKWWKNLIINGMGQFFYENKINFRQVNFLKIKSQNVTRKGNVTLNRTRTFLALLENRVLVPIGGGKDSIVTLELLKRAGKNVQCFSSNPTEVVKKIIKIGECRRGPRSGRVGGGWRPIIVKRKIDPKLLELNQQGFLNGHTPFSAYLAFLSVLVAVLFNYKYIAFSNERSSNEGNVKYLGKIVNHQYSKTFDFEKKFREYSKKYLVKNIEYFSFLRPLYDIQIAKLFSNHPKYFSSFLSCNVAYQTASGTKKPIGKWCGNCPKCLFVFATLYPFVEEQKLIKIFGENLFDKKTLLLIMQELIGERKFKPFECVGTKKESLIAFYLSWKKNRHLNNSTYVYLLRYFQDKILPKYPNLEKESRKILNAWNNQHNLPRSFEKMLKIN